jgi:hypothetical protein
VLCGFCQGQAADRMTTYALQAATMRIWGVGWEVRTQPSPGGAMQLLCTVLCSTLVPGCLHA